MQSSNSGVPQTNGDVIEFPAHGLLTTSPRLDDWSLPYITLWTRTLGVGKGGLQRGRSHLCRRSKRGGVEGAYYINNLCLVALYFDLLIMSLLTIAYTSTKFLISTSMLFFYFFCHMYWDLTLFEFACSVSWVISLVVLSVAHFGLGPYVSYVMVLRGSSTSLISMNRICLLCFYSVLCFSELGWCVHVIGH